MAVARFVGRPVAFVGALALVLGWAASGPLMGFSQAWQMVINTGTTIITFLMVFLIQRAQNKDTTAVQLKLDTLIAATQAAANSMMAIEDKTEAELETAREDIRRGGDE